MSKKIVTMEHIAGLAGVSKSTVSRALADSPSISDETKAKIHGIIAELGYTPNEIARSLAVRRSNNIGLILPSDADESFFHSDFFHGALDGITAAAAKNKYDLLIPQRGLPEIEAIQRFIRGKKVEGFLLLRSYLEDAAIDYLSESDFPFVVIGSYKSDVHFHCVDNDTYGMAYQVTRKLIEYGCRSVAILEAEPEAMHVHRKLQGYADALKDAELGEESIHIFDMTRDGVQSLFAMEPRVDGIVVGDHSGAKLVGEEMLRLGIGLEEIKVGMLSMTKVFQFSPLVDVMLDIHTEQLGSLSCEKLIALIKGEQTEQTTIVPFEIFTRKS